MSKPAGSNTRGVDHDPLAGAWGFDPATSPSHFVVQVRAGSQQPVDISEHLSWDPAADGLLVRTSSERVDGQLICRLDRLKWNGIADPLRAEFNARLKTWGHRPGRWKTGANVVGRALGKELVLLAWAIEDADPALIPVAIGNWLGLAPEERWWLYTMTAAATGGLAGRGRGWRKAVRYALTENPIGAHREGPTVPEFYLQAASRIKEPDPPEYGSGTPPLRKVRG